MKFGVIHYNAPGETLEEFLDYAAETGFDCVELQGGDVWPVGCENPEAVAEQAKKWLDARNLECSALAAQNDFVVLAAADVEFQVARMKRMCGLAQILGCDVIRYEVGAPNESVTMERWGEAMVNCLKRCAEWAEPMGMKLGVDNHGIVTNDGDLLRWTLEQVNSPSIGTNLDTMNYRWFGNDLPTCERYYKEMAKYTFHTHMKDGFGWRERYRGKALGEGEVPLMTAVNALKEIGYQGAWTAEYEDRTVDSAIGYKKCLEWMKANIPG